MQELADFNFFYSFRNLIRWCLMPGIDLFTRRRVRLCQYWNNRPRRVLDAGSGNGWFSFLAYRSGAAVTAVNIAKEQIQKANLFYNEWMKIPTDRLKFLQMNLYEIEHLEPGFDEIICYETLEHIRDDEKVCHSFWRLLKPGGFLHLCCPNAEHPRWRNENLDEAENGYHVRPGYTLDSYRSLLQPIGFRISEIEEMGGPLLVKFTRLVQKIQACVGDFWTLPVALLSFPFVWLDPSRLSCPYSIYVKAVKPNHTDLNG